MVDVTTAAPTPVGVSGLSATPLSAIDVQIADAVVVGGLPAVPRFPTPTPQATPDAATAEVLDENGTFIANLPHTAGLKWMDEFNNAGSGSIDVRRYDGFEDEHPGVWAPGNQVMVRVGLNDVMRIVTDADAGYQRDADTAERFDQWTGLGSMGVLNSGMVEPEYGWRAEATDERSFDYGSNPNIGGWYVPSEWHRPVGKLIRSSWRWTFKKRHLPKKWPDRRAQWIWWRNPDLTTTKDETCYFVGSFTLSRARRVKIWAAGDDSLELQLDGEIRITAGPGNWKKASTFVIHLSAGTHYVAAKVANMPGSVGNANRSGFICSIARMDGNGDVAGWLLRTNETAWKVRRQLTGAPGWWLGQILLRLVTEQKTRGCAGHSQITFGFDTARDSNGVPWSGSREERSFTIGTLGLDYVQTLVEAGIDAAMTPGLVLNAYTKRGADRSGWVRFDQGDDSHPLDESGAQPPPNRNVAYAHANTGWVGRTDDASIAATGRRETVITLGSSRSPAQTAAALASMLPDMADPPQTITIKTSGGSPGPQPYVDYWPGDWVGARPAGALTWGRYRVMSISGEGTEAGPPDWTTELYEDPA